MFQSLASTIGIAALAAFALLAVWLALESAKRLTVQPSPFWMPKVIGLRVYFGAYFAGVRKAFKYPRLALELTLRPAAAVRFSFMPAIAGGSPEVDLDENELTEGEKKELAEVGEKAAELRTKLVERLAEIKGEKGEDKEEVERREKELGEQVDKLIGLEQKRESTEVQDFKAEVKESLERMEKQFERLGKTPARLPLGAPAPLVKAEDRYPGENLFADMVAARKEGNQDAFQRLDEYEQKFASPERLKAWAQGELEENDLILPDIQQALPFLRAQAKAVQLFRELRTSSPSVEFPVWKTGLKVDHVKPGDPKPESEPTFDLEVAQVFWIAGISDVPNGLLEDFPAARGWISTELGAATGAQEETDVLIGSGEGEPLGLYTNKEIPTRKVEAAKEASAGRNIISSAFRGAQQVRITGFMEPTDILLNPAVWTDVVLSFESNIGFLYGPPQMEGSADSGPPTAQPPARILGLPVTWSSYVPIDEGKEKDESSLVVGNFNDGIILRRTPFRVDVDTSIGFKKNMTSFRGEERIGFIVVRPKSFVRVTGIVPSPVV